MSFVVCLCLLTKRFQEQELCIHQNKRISELEQKIIKCQCIEKYESITDREALEKQEKKIQKEKKAEPAPAGNACAQPAAKFCTIKVCECVPETYTTTRTVYERPRLSPRRTATSVWER